MDNHLKEIHPFVRNYFAVWFPNLSGYKAFSARVDFLAEAFRFLAVYLIVSFKPKDCSLNISLLDSMSVFTYTQKIKKGYVNCTL